MWEHSYGGSVTANNMVVMTVTVGIGHQHRNLGFETQG
jgi:hypothetical protein